MEDVSHKTCKARFSVMLVKAERAEHFIDIQPSCLGSRVQTPPTCLPAKMFYSNF